MHDKVRFELKITREFIEGLATVCSERLLGQIRGILETLTITTEIGSTHVRTCLTEQYGPGIRKIPVSTFVIVFRIIGSSVEVLALVYGPTIR